MDACIKQYLNFSESVFRLGKNILRIPVGENKAYFSEPLGGALKKVILEATKSDDTPLVDNGNPSCPVFVVTTYSRITNGQLKLFKLYGFDKDQMPIWQAWWATSSALGFFPPTKIDISSGLSELFVNGGVSANNSSLNALVEAKNY